MPHDLIEIWALTTGAVLVYVKNWIALLVIVSLLWRLRRARARDGVLDMLDAIRERLDEAVILPKVNK